MVTPLQANASDLDRELGWFADVLDARLKLYFGKTCAVESVLVIPPPNLSESDSPYALFLKHYEWTSAERIVVLMALIPLIRPQLLDVLWSKNETTERGFTEFGGVHGATHGGFIPTGETAAFILAGDDLASRFEITRLFEGDHFFARHNILHLSSVQGSESLLSGALTLSREYRHLFTTGIESKPSYNSEFPARLIETHLDWDYLILPETTLEQLDEIKHWILHGQRLLQDWEMEKKIQPGFTSLFCGPPGTGKTLSACLLGQHCGCDVYKIDLSMIASKYIGETEKNLARIFDLAEHKNWILFFDEADALFGKRTQVQDSHDRFANQEISFLLQRIEEFHGVVILTSNIKANIDDAFIRRFHSVVNFPMPKPAERRRIWANAFSSKAVMEQAIDLDAVAARYDLSGGTIMNVVRYSSLKALSRNANIILLEDIEAGVRREFLKEGRTV
ncbi:MAG: ATP-binding protein [Chthoniobacterales bacterium]|nr:ATP-binding protein [Chthoniobacterales bacterium]